MRRTLREPLPPLRDDASPAAPPRSSAAVGSACTRSPSGTLASLPLAPASVPIGITSIAPKTAGRATEPFAGRAAPVAAVLSAAIDTFMCSCMRPCASQNSTVWKRGFTSGPYATMS